MKPEEVKEAVEAQAKEIKTVMGKLQDSHKELDGTIDQIKKDIGAHGKEFDNTKTAFQDCVKTVSKLEDEVEDLVLKMTSLPTQLDSLKSLGQISAETAKALNFKGGNAVLADIEGPLFAKAVTSASTSGGSLVQPLRQAGIVVGPEQQLAIRDLLTVLTTASNAVEWVREKMYTNNAGSRAEGAAASESNITFEKKSTSVETIAHWVPASRQILSDAPGLQTFIDQRMRYGLKHEEENQILFGDGTNGNLLGLTPQATAFNTALSQPGDTKIDQLRRSILQVAMSKYSATGIVMNPADWCELELMKTADNAYLFANPVNQNETRLWGKKVVEALSMDTGDFLTGAFGMGATLWDREQVSARIAEQHADFFIKGMVAMICEERLALTVERPAAFVTGTLTTTPP